MENHTQMIIASGMEYQNSYSKPVIALNQIYKSQQRNIQSPTTSFNHPSKYAIHANFPFVNPLPRSFIYARCKQTIVAKKDNIKVLYRYFGDQNILSKSRGRELDTIASHETAMKGTSSIECLIFLDKILKKGDITESSLNNIITQYFPTHHISSLINKMALVLQKYKNICSLPIKQNPYLIMTMLSPYANTFCNICKRFSCHTHTQAPYSIKHINEAPDNSKYPKIISSYTQYNKICQLDCFKKFINHHPPLTTVQRELVECLAKPYKCNSCKIARFIFHVEEDSTISCASVNKIICSLQKADIQAPTSPKNAYAKKAKAYLPQEAYKAMKNNQNEYQYKYVPCYHPSTACSKMCKCVKERGFCEKWCLCNSDCKFRFKGCQCVLGKCLKTHCICKWLQRGCDTDLCKNCCKLNEKRSINCKNLNEFTCFHHSKTALAFSDVCSGWGLFALQPIAIGEIVGEYAGELLTNKITEYRSSCYELDSSFFLFLQNESTMVDATFMGNKTRFINHSIKEVNVEPRILFMGGDHKIVFFAVKEIIKGEEILFNYDAEQSLEDKFQWITDKTQRKRKLPIESTIPIKSKIVKLDSIKLNYYNTSNIKADSSS